MDKKDYAKRAVEASGKLAEFNVLTRGLSADGASYYVYLDGVRHECKELSIGIVLPPFKKAV